ncbi:opioid growth factor receptor [Glossophaga mutica]
MDDPDRDSTWEDDEEDGEDPSAGGDDDGEAGAPRGAEDAEDAEEEEEARPSALPSRTTELRNWRAVRDTRRYRHRYPDLIERDSNGDMPNLSFYRNEIEFLPNGCLIETVLRDWKDDYDTLEDNHCYIQWLFPLREPGVNWHAKPLTLREIQEFKSSKEARERFVRAYELMLGFYGIELQDRDSGAVRRALNYQKRFQNLNWHSHNNLRITRILKSLGELGLERYQAPLVRFFLEETLVHRQLPGVRQSVLDYFVFTVRCPRQRRALLRFAWEHFRPRRKFVWGPHDKLQRRALRSPPRPPSPVAPSEAQGEESPGDAHLQEGACGPGPSEGRDSVAAGPQLASSEPQEQEQERDQGEQAEDRGEEGPEPSSPKESKKRKLEANRREQAPGEAGPQSSSEVEKIAQNLEDCALSQGGLGAGTQEMGSQETGETEPPCPPPAGAKVPNDEVRKRRKVDQTLAPTWPPARPGPPEAGVGENGVEEEAAAAEDQSQVAPEQGAPQSSAAEEPAVDQKAEPAEAGLTAEAQTP